MARNHTRPRYWKSRGGYYVTVNGTQVLLAKGKKADPVTKNEALRRFHEVLLEKGTPREEKASSLIVSSLVDKYLTEKINRLTPRNSEIIARRYLGLFRASFGKLPLTSLSLPETRQWIESFSSWGSATRSLCAVTILKCLNYHYGLVSHPLKGLAFGYEVPSRGRDASCLITDAIHQQLLLAASSTTTRNVLQTLHDTGARPGEILQATASMYDPRLHALLPTHRKVKQKHRTVFLPASLEETIIRPLCLQYPEGPLFRNTRGLPMRVSRLNAWMLLVREKLGLGPITPYGYRHKFCCDYLLAGGRIAVLARLLGTSIRIIEKHYSHIGDYHDELLEDLRQFRH